MKKLLTILAASAMFFAFGDNINNGINFETYTATGEGSFNPNDNDPGTNVYFWCSASTEGNVISNHVEGALEGLSRPDMFNGQSNTNFLYLETEAPLFRTVAPNGHVPSEFTGVSILENPIYLDTLVKFTAADSAFESLEDAADKIAIEYVEHEEESHEEGGQPVIDSAGFTNFVVRAGYLSSPISQTNYIVKLPANFDKDAWHRLTVRSFGSIDAAGDVGFVIYLDGVALEYDAAVDAGPNFTPTGAAAAFYTDSFRALFPSAVPSNQTGGQAIAAVAFSGNGSVDDVVFTTTMPTFIKNSEEVRTEITLGTGVTDVTAMVAGTSYEAVETNNTLFVFNLPAGTTEFDLDVTADTANGYTFDPATCITTSNDVTYVGATITITGGSPALTVVGKRDNAYYMNGDTKVGFATLSEAFAQAPANATIKLGYNYSVADQETTTQLAPVYTISKNLTLDLNGKTLDGGSSDTRALFKVSNGYALTIIDSVPGDDGSIVYGGTMGMFDGDQSNGDVILGSATDCGPVFIGPVIGTASGWTGYVSYIVRGKFTAADNTAENGKFICATDEKDQYDVAYGIDVVDGDSTVTLDGSYWVVEPQGGSSDTPIAVPTAATGLVYDGTLQTGVTAGTGYTLSGDYEATDAGTYTATATLAQGYIWSDNTSEAKSITWSIAAKTDATVVVTLSADIAEYSAQLEFPTASATIGNGVVQGTPAWDPNTITEPAAGATNTYTVTFTVTTANYAGSTGTATFKVWKAASGGSYPTYIGDDTAKQAKYDEWKDAYGDDTASAYEDAFLLNCAPANVDTEKAAFKFTKIAFEGGVWVTETTTKNTSNANYNGTVTVKRYSDVGCKTEDTNGSFFKAELK